MKESHLIRKIMLIVIAFTAIGFVFIPLGWDNLLSMFLPIFHAN